MKWQRRYKMQIEGDTQTWEIDYPFTCRFSMTATGTPTANSATFMFVNLPQTIRQDIRTDLWDDYFYRRVVFRAGYLEDEPNLTAIFVGNVVYCYTYRQGPDWITEMECLDGGWALATANIEYPAPADTSFFQILQHTALGLQPVPYGDGGVGIGIISKNLKVPSNPSRGQTITGSPFQQLIAQIQPINGTLFINQERIYILGQNEYIPNTTGIATISPDTGMIGSPRQAFNIVTATMVFEPRLQVMQKITLLSDQPYAGDCIVRQVAHRGVISPVESGELVTMATFFRAPASQLVEAA